MTEQQAKVIRELREQGVGYSAIRNRIGLSRDIVRNFCKAKGLSGFGKAVVKNIEEQVMLGKQCLYCGKDISQPGRGRPKKFCTNRCRREWWKIHPECLQRKEEALYKKVCKHCGCSFVSYGNKNRIYCSHECYIQERFWEGEDEISNTTSITY